MNIPDEAVEAAAWAAYELKPVELFGREHPITWEQLSDSPLGQRCKDNELAKARAALEAAAPHMLAQVSTLEDLDALPRFSVIRSDEGAVFERQTMWHEAGSRDLKYSPDIALPATVLQLGWGEE